MTAIKEITVEETYPLRHQVLRPHQSIDECKYHGDRDSLTRHFGTYVESKLVGIVSIYKSPLNHIHDKDCWQIRAMAMDVSVRKKGYANEILKKAEAYALENGAKYIWCNARVSALGFYEKNNYALYGKEFYVEDIGQHYIMIKESNTPI